MSGSKALAVGFFFAAAAIPAAAQVKQGPVTLTTHQLKGGVYWVQGGTSNTGFVVGDKGVVIFDAQMTQEGVQKELAEIAKITPKPVDNIVISHGDPDHVAGIPFYPPGIPIIAHENTTPYITASANDPNAPPLFAGLYKPLLNHLPTHSVGSTETMVLDGVRMVLMYVAPAHTSGDLVGYLPDQKIVFGGDIILTNTGRFPVVHLGGSSLGWIATMKAILALDADTYIPGHGPIESKSMLQARLQEVEQRREQVKAMVMQHKSRAEVEQALPEPGASPMFLTFTQTVYDELTKGYPEQVPPWANMVQK